MKKARSISRPGTMEERAVRALQQTWQSIGYDVLACYGDAERAILDASEIRESVTGCGLIGGYPESYGNDVEAVRWLEEQSEAKQRRIINQAFPKGRYGA